MNAWFKCPVATAFALPATILCTGCAQTFQLPMTSEQLANHGSAAALIAYLGQPDANASVCESGTETTRLRQDSGLPEEFIAALRDGKIPPPVWEKCAASTLEWLDPSVSTELVERIARSEADLLGLRSLETNTSLQAQLSALHRTYVERGTRISASSRVLDEVASKVRSKAAANQLGPSARGIGEELVDAIDLEHGVWRGHPVDASTLDVLSNTADDATLLMFARRLTSPALREEAERRVVRLRIAKSPFSEIRGAAAPVEEAVMNRGTNPVSLDTHPPLRASLDSSRSIERRVIVQQQLNAQTATLLGVSDDRPTQSVLPELPLQDVLAVSLDGVEHPITVCPPGRALDPTPCIAPTDLKSTSSLAAVDRNGTVRFADQLSEPQAVALAHETAVEVPILIGDKPLIEISRWLWFSRPDNMVFAGSNPGGAGPNLEVEVERLATGRLVYSMVGADRAMQAVVEWPDGQYFRVISLGAPGSTGWNGTDGSDGNPGTSGSSASCPWSEGRDGSRGGDDGNGGSGGAGGAGGNGGDIHVVVSGPRSLREETLALVRATVASKGREGGDGGRGGRGGRGGAGGSGGSGASCTDSDGNTTFLRGGMTGPSGSDGRDGWDGPPGPPGAPGTVLVEWRDVGPPEQSAR
jgi:hypothetical protein